MTVYTFSNERRNDPEIRAMVERIVKARNEALLEAARRLQEVVDGMRPLSLGGDSAIYERCFYAVRSASIKVSNDAAFMNRLGINECYIGNEAASQLGEYVQKYRKVDLPLESKVEYEYNIEETDTKTGVKRVWGFWGTLEDEREGIANRRSYEQNLADYGNGVPRVTFALVRRPKVGYEIVEGE
jgi:hypothetical protein